MNFVTDSACKGSMPSLLAGSSFFNRNSLLAAMMRNREAVRYVLAPFGFGKSLLACSYAKLVNEFQHTFWMDGSNPCFLRDLDADSLLSDLLDASDVGSLVVFDDIPLLGATRRAAMWELCRGLVDAKREVVVCATASADPLWEHAAECITINASDLLYSDADLEALRSAGYSVPASQTPLSPTARVPALVLASAEEVCGFFRAHIDELDDPAQVALSFAMLVLERGSFEDLEVLLGREVSSGNIDTLRLRPFAVVDDCNAEFALTGLPLNEVVQAFNPFMAQIAFEMDVDDASEVAGQCAETLLERGNTERATQLVVRMCNPRARSVWLTQHQDAFMDRGALAAAESIYESLRNGRWTTRPELRTASCVRRALLDHAEGALHDLVQVAHKVDFPLSQRLLAASYFYVLNESAEDAQELEELFYAQVKSLRNEVKSLDETQTALWAFWSGAASPKCSMARLVKKIGYDPSSALALACCIHKCRVGEQSFKGLDDFQKQTCALFAAQEKVPQTLALSLLRKEIDAAGFDLDTSSFAVIAAYHRCDAFEDDLEVQRTMYARKKAEKLGAISLALHAQAAQSSVMPVATPPAAPLLEINLFGGFEVLMGGVPVNRDYFKRKKVRVLLALLTLECGHDLSCDNLARRLWADYTPLQSRHSLNNAVFYLRKGLSLSDGSCPYLKRQHGVMSLRRNLVKSDIGFAKELCTRLRFSDPEPEAYGRLLDQIQDVYKGLLMPSETSEPMIIAAREEWRNRLVGALLFAAQRLAATGDTFVSLQLVEFALACDPQREDCYEQLMTLQARSGQRPAAIETWMRYRSFLYEELGLDPSPRISKLYERIIKEEDPLRFNMGLGFMH